ncbi:hypothetical protein DMENIID0001_004160 [Sergentomyia squamirostris]
MAHSLNRPSWSAIANSVKSIKEYTDSKRITDFCSVDSVRELQSQLKYATDLINSLDYFKQNSETIENFSVTEHHELLETTTSVQAKLAEYLNIVNWRVRVGTDGSATVSGMGGVKDSPTDRNASQAQNLNSTLNSHNELSAILSAFMKSQSESNAKMADAIKNLVDSRGSSVPSVSSHRTQTKLQPIPLPSFSGDFSSWITFRDVFLSLIDKDPRLSKVDKMHYLLLSLSGDALQLIDSMPITDANYESAWGALVSRYEDSYSIVNANMKRLMSISPLSSESASGLSQLHATANSVLRSLASLSLCGGEHWVIFILKEKLDPESQKLWARHTKGRIPSYDEFNVFLIDRVRELESCSQRNKPSNSSKPQPGAPHKTSVLVSASDPSSCPCCGSPHKLFQCSSFRSLSPQDRFALVKKFNLCRNCISSTHLTRDCQSRACSLCSQKHNTLLHDSFSNSLQSGNVRTPNSGSVTGTSTQLAALFQSSSASGSLSDLPTQTHLPQTLSDAPTSSEPTQIPEDENPRILAATVNPSRNIPRVFLGTVILKILDYYGQEHLCRAVVDNCSQSNLITNNLIQKLKLPKRHCQYNIGGVLDHKTEGKYKAKVHISSRMGGDFYTLNCNVVPKITGNLPNFKVNAKDIPIPSNLLLADPSWHVSQPIDILIGCGLYSRIEHDKSHALGPSLPKLKSTEFGWVLMGEHCQMDNTGSEGADTEEICTLTTLSSIESTLRKFFELETIPKTPPLSQEQKEVEEFFLETTTRNEEGRFVVKLPFKPNIQRLASNYNNAKGQLLHLERKLNTCSEKKTSFHRAMRENFDLGFVEEVPTPELNRESYYLPFHAVIRESSATTKCRIVFNGSSKSSSGLSLNDTLKVGPIVHPDLITNLLRFRRNPFAFTCDITKMFPQFLLYPPHRDRQRFLWRENSSDPIKHYRLKGVCFGLACSPHLATRCLKQLALDEAENYPIASRLLLENFYVDDCLASLPSFEEAERSIQELTELLKTAGLSLAKWNSNNSSLLASFQREVQQDEIVFLPDLTTKTLGMKWNTVTDSFYYDYTPRQSEFEATKRNTFSVVASLFDPLGLIGPTILLGKMLLQQTWAHEDNNWDAPLPADISAKLCHYFEDLRFLNKISVPRCISTIGCPVKSELHLFTDASDSAFGACVYYVTEDAQGGRCSRLLISKSRVGPLRSLTTARLELCGAVLGAQLLDRILEVFSVDSYHCWTDSKVVLGQINATLEKYDVFVSHRISEIQQLTDKGNWRHVPGVMNPADIVSRGVGPESLSDNHLWWSGPSFLTGPNSDWPPPYHRSQRSDDRENECEISAANVSEPTSDTSFVARCLQQSSDFAELIDLIAISRRYLDTLLKRGPQVGPLSSRELQNAERIVIKWDQERLLGEVINLVRSGKIATSGKYPNIRQLSPFIDDHGLLRVGGRLQRSNEFYSTCHPVLLARGEVASLIVRAEHRRLKHAGPQQLLYSLRGRYWILSARVMCRQVVRGCLICFRMRPPIHTQIMGELPSQRVSDPIPFVATGIDFAGPIFIRRGHYATVTLIKTYICVFVCLATRAVHLEVVSDLSTEAFIACLRRFIARRSTPTDLYSDNATNFTGASRELNRLFSQSQSQAEILTEAANLKINWHFQPPLAPHHGGLWEAAVKSMKHHLHRVMGTEKFTLEELHTVVTQIEGIMNSRPLTEMSGDPSEPRALTPGHFLIGRPIMDFPSPALTHIPVGRLDTWQRVQRLVQEFGRRWRRDYLTALQRRTRWQRASPNLKIGDVVVVFEESSPSLKWPLGRIVDIHPGPDRRVRVVTVQTAKGEYQRSIGKISRLPTEELTPCDHH